MNIQNKMNKISQNKPMIVRINKNNTKNSPDDVTYS